MNKLCILLIFSKIETIWCVSSISDPLIFIELCVHNIIIMIDKSFRHMFSPKHEFYRFFFFSFFECIEMLIATIFYHCFHRFMILFKSFFFDSISSPYSSVNSSVFIFFEIYTWAADSIRIWKSNKLFCFFCIYQHKLMIARLNKKIIFWSLVVSIDF